MIHQYTACGPSMSFPLHCFHFIDVHVGFVVVARLWSWPALEHKAMWFHERDFLVSRTTLLSSGCDSTTAAEGPQRVIQYFPFKCSAIFGRRGQTCWWRFFVRRPRFLRFQSAIAARWAFNLTYARWMKDGMYTWPALFIHMDDVSKCWK